MEILIHNDDLRLILNEDDEYKVITEAVNKSSNIRLRLYRSLNFIEEKDAFSYIKSSEEYLLILYTVRSNHRYYFWKFGEKILQIITNNDYEIYAIRNMSKEFEGLS
jgi:hypothetical protein